jgi:TPR repeat protein
MSNRELIYSNHIQRAAKEGEDDAEEFLRAVKEQDKTKAFSMFLNLSEKGYSIATYQVSLCYRYGIGCEQDDDKACLYLKKSQMEIN